jgi:hypothetical protein
MCKVLSLVLVICGMSSAVVLDSLGNPTMLDTDSVYVKVLGPTSLTPTYQCGRGVAIYGRFYGNSMFTFELEHNRWTLYATHSYLTVPLPVEFATCGNNRPPCDTVTCLIGCISDTVRADTGYRVWVGIGNRGYWSRELTIPSISPTAVVQHPSLSNRVSPVSRGPSVRADGRVLSKRNIMIRKGVLVIR